jgi:prophage regulatory protein
MTTMLKFKALQDKLGGRSRAAIYRDMDAGRLPRPVKMGASPLWVENEVDAAIERLRQKQEAS